MNDHRNIHEWISRFSDGELNEGELQQFHELLAKDPGLKAETDLDGELSAFLRDRELQDFLEMVDQAKSKKRSGFGLNCLLLAAILIVFAGLSGFWIYLNQGSGKQQATHIQPGKETRTTIRKSPGFPHIKPAKEVQKQELIADNFKPLIYLEGIVGVVTRSASFSVLLPPNTVRITPGDSLNFLWQGQGSADLSIDVLNNMGEKIVWLKGIRGQSLTLPTTSWEEGLYYWKLIEGENLAHVGKIIVRR